VEQKTKVNDLLNFVLIDSSKESYPERASMERLNELGIQLIETKLINKAGDTFYDPQRLASALLSLT